MYPWSVTGGNSQGQLYKQSRIHEVRGTRPLFIDQNGGEKEKKKEKEGTKQNLYKLKTKSYKFVATDANLKPILFLKY